MKRNSIRLAIGAVLAIPVAGGLFFIMQYMIAMADPDIDDKKQRKLADIHMPEREIETNLAEAKPDKPDDPEEPPPDLDTPDLEMDMNMDAINMAPAATLDVSIAGSGGMSASDGEYLPIVKVAPIYPRRAQSRGIEGYCIMNTPLPRTARFATPRPSIVSHRVCSNGPP